MHSIPLLDKSDDSHEKVATQRECLAPFDGDRPTMHLLTPRSAFLCATFLGLSACPGDDSGDDSNDSANDGSTTAMMSASTGDDPSTGAPGDSTTGPDDTTGELVLADVEVTVTYDGTETMGNLNVVALTEFPPMGPPLATASQMDPTFPFTGTLMALEPGEYIIFAVFDVGEENPTIPGPEDPTGMAAMPITIDGPGPFSVDVTLVDPM